MAAETILFHFAKYVFDRLSSGIVEEAKLALGVEKELNKIVNNLSSIKAVLRDAEKQQNTSDSVRVWLEDLEDVVYDIDDLLDEIATEAAIHNKNNGDTYRQVRKLFSRTNPLVLHLLWAHRIKDVCEKLDLIANKRNNFNFIQETMDALEDSRETHSRIVQSEILGRDQDKESLMNIILDCRNFEKVSVVPIVGFGGIGKTTLAKLIFNDVRVDENFDKKIWLHVPHKYNLKKVLGMILSLATGENTVELTLEQLQVRLNEALKDTRYFIILDDWWNEDSTAWRSFKELIDVGAKGSTVVVTTRNSKVASKVKSIPEYRLSELSDETCLLIFKQLAFREGQEIQPALLKLAKKTIELSRGLPLLVTTLGNLLHGETDERVWHHVIQKLKQGHEDILKVLKLSYDQLPSYLKRCFQVCPIFQKGVVINPTIMVSIWMALGFLPCEDRAEPLEHIGRKCINELSSKSLFLDVSTTHTDELDDLRLHDFMYDLARSVAGDELAFINCSTKEVSKKVRYIRLDEDDLSGKQLHERLLSKANKARLFMLYTLEKPPSKDLLKSIISNFKCLRVLDFGDCQFEKLPKTIGYLRHLRFLNLSNNRRIKQLPASLCNLLNLQTLLLNGCTNLQELPAGIGRLENLRYLTVTTQQKILPDDIGNLISLQTLYLIECPRLAFLPSTAKNLENLDSLWIVDCKELDLEHGSWSAEGLNSLRVLLIKGLPKFQELSIHGVLPFTPLQHLLVAECENLLKLDWIEHFPSLRTLILSYCPTVHHLPSRFLILKKLEMLGIEGCSCLTEGFLPSFSTLGIPKTVIDGVNVSESGHPPCLDDSAKQVAPICFPEVERSVAGNLSIPFKLEDLLRAEAELLGKGIFGTMYKAVMDSGVTLAVKRLKYVEVPDAEEFKVTAQEIGKLDHENLVVVRDFYACGDERLLICDYFPLGSLYAALHGNKTPLNWESRFMVALGTARGVRYIHSQGPTTCHGNIKSSNILLSNIYEACVSDFGIAQLAQFTGRVSAYHAPELSSDPQKVSQKADVYSFGVVLLELLTGKVPTENEDLPRWIPLMARGLSADMAEKMNQLSQLAVDCTCLSPEKRPTMEDITARIEHACGFPSPQGLCE